VAEGTGCVEEGMPEGGAEGSANFPADGAPSSFWGCEPVEIVFRHAGMGQAIGSVFDGGETRIGFCEFMVAASVFVIPDAFDAFGVIAVIVILMDGTDEFGDVDDGSTKGVRFADEPVVPPDAADDEGRNFFVEASREKEVIDVVVEALDTLAFCEGDNLFLPIGFCEVERFGDVRVPAAADHEMVRIPGGESAMGIQKILSENNVAIRIADGLVTCDLLGAVEDGIEAFCAEFGAKDFRFVTNAELATDFCGSGIVTEYNDFDVGMEEFPGLK